MTLFHSLLTPVVAVGEPALAHEWQLTGSEVFWQALVIFGIILLNAFFVVCEFSLVKVRSSQLQAEADEGSAGAKFAQEISRKLEAYLAAGQLGITLTSIALGMLGEPFVGHLIQPLLFKIGLTNEAAIHSISLLGAYSLVTYFHVVIGEQLPKQMAIREALKMSILIARPLHLFYVVMRPAIAFLGASTNTAQRLLFGVSTSGDHDNAHSEEELRHIVADSQRSKEVTETEKDILLNALALNDLYARDVMTPRNQVISWDLDESFEANLKVVIESKHTRFPLVNGHLDDSIGVIHIKDLLPLIGTHAPDLKKITRKLVPVPPLMPIDKLLRVFLDQHLALALVVDEFGGALGVVTLDNVLEEIVGDIQDEFDTDKPEFDRINDKEFNVEGTLNLYELSDLAGLEVESDDVSTVGGYVTHVLGHMPKVGEKVAIGSYEVTITKVDPRRVQQLHFRWRPEEECKGSELPGEDEE
jgi:CBS domain containing-hemolysin-like protein